MALLTQEQKSQFFTEACNLSSLVEVKSKHTLSDEMMVELINFILVDKEYPLENFAPEDYTLAKSLKVIN